MSLFHASYIVIGGICLAVGLLHLLIYSKRPNLRVHLLFSLMALASALSNYFDLHMYLCREVSTFTWYLKATNTTQGLLWILFVWFIHDYTRDDKKIVPLLVSGLYIVAVVINIVSSSGVLFSTIERLEFVVLPWGESIPAAIGQASPWRLLPDMSWLLLLGYAGFRCFRLAGSGNRRRALYFGASLFICLGFGYLHGTLVDLAILPPPGLWYVSFLALILLMSGALASDVVSVPSLKNEISVQETKWQSLVDHAKMLVLGLDTAGRITYANPYFYEITRYSHIDVTGRRITDFLPREERSEVRQRIAAASKGELREQSHRKLLTREGEIRHIHLSHVLLKEPSGEVSGTLSIGEDVTELQAVHKEILDEKERMDVILGTLNTGLALLDENLQVLWVNETLSRFFPEEQIIGKPCYEVAENRHEPCAQCGALMAFKDGKVHETERQNKPIGRWVHIISLPIKNQAGEVVQVLEATTDITERKQLEESRDRYLGELQQLKEELERENIFLKEEISSSHQFSEIIGESNALLYVLSAVQQVATTDTTVLIQGETGVGKELVAQAIFRASNSSDRPFIRVDCAGILTSLVESELFGHEAGAFTGADRRRLGRFELADGGTIFLDEISELPLDVQAKLLRVIQEREFERVGGNITIPVDVRIIAATNRSLSGAVAGGHFRADLYYRLNVYPITVPPLRKRRSDIPLLVNHFVKQFNKKTGTIIDQVPAAVMEQLSDYSWPGNIRELRNVIERAVITSPGTALQLPEAIEKDATKKAPVVEGSSAPSLLTLQEVEHDHIVRVLKAKDWRISGERGAARVLGLNPSTLRFRMKKLGIKKN